MNEEVFLICLGNPKQSTFFFRYLILPKQFLPNIHINITFPVYNCLFVCKIVFLCVCMCVWMGWGGGGGASGCIRHIIHQLVNMDFFILPPFPLFWDTGNVWVKKQPSKVNWTRERWKEKKKDGVSIIWGQEKQSQPAPLFILILQMPNTFPSLHGLLFILMHGGKLWKPFCLWLIFLFFYCWPSNLYKFKWAGGNCVVCMLNLCANSDLLLGELNENAVEFSIRKERYGFLLFFFIGLNCFLSGWNVYLLNTWIIKVECVKFSEVIVGCWS